METTAPRGKCRRRDCIERQVPLPARGVFTFLFFGFLGGIILNLMPCVLPVISLKIFGFIQHAGPKPSENLAQRHRLRRRNFRLVYRSGAALDCAQSCRSRSYLGRISIHESLFRSLVERHRSCLCAESVRRFRNFAAAKRHARIAELDRRAKAKRARSFQGVFATVLATPCTAPFLGTALGFAFTQSAAIILSMFVAIAAGMSAPYLLLCAQPAWLRFLPKPGPWMVHVKQFMGFLLLATLLFLLYVLGAQRGLDGAHLGFVLLLIVSSHRVLDERRFLSCRLASATTRVIVARADARCSLLASGVYFIGEKFRCGENRFGAIHNCTATGRRSHPSVCKRNWSRGHSVFVDFTAAWCLTCKFNEASVLESAAVREAFQRHGIVKLKADWTNGDPVITKLLQQFGRPGVPLYVLYPGKSAEPIVFPELLTKSIILDKLETISRTVASQ